MEKLNQTFKINPLYEADGYKVGHPLMIAPGTTREYWTWIPRSTKYMPGGIDEIMSAGQQLVVRYIHSAFQEFFFNQPVEVAHKFTKDMSKYLRQDYNFSGFEELHELGYLPIRIKALPEGIFTKPNIPHMSGINTVDGYAWLGLFLETLISKLAWQLPTSATIGNKFKENAVKWVLKTDKDNIWLADFMCHDFSSRGGNPFTSIAVGLGHAMSNSGSDTLNVIPASRYYYDFDEEEVPVFSVNASEHSVSTTKIFTVGEQQMLSDWMKLFPKGILSVVSDTFDLWKLITEYLPALKDEILARDGKLVIRPDSGDPVDIICGIHPDNLQTNLNGRYTISNYRKVTSNEEKGVIELLWETFGGTINEQGYKVLDPHIGAIYGDSINLERQIQIYERLAAKGFAATNVVLGVGSYTYVMLTRDSAGYAAKGAWFEVAEEKTDWLPTQSPEAMEPAQWTEKKGYNIYKDPITDDGTKKSLKGFQYVGWKSESGYYVQGEVTEEMENHDTNMLQTIYENGKFYNQTTLTEIRERIKQRK